MDCTFLVAHICIREKITKCVCFMATFSSTILSMMSIIILKVSISCKNILDSYNKKSIIIIL